MNRKFIQALFGRRVLSALPLVYVVLAWVAVLVIFEPRPKGSTPRDDSSYVSSKEPLIGSYVRDGFRTCLSTVEGFANCTCDEGFTGSTCEQALCPAGCIHGQCLRPNKCICEDGFGGNSCEDPVCECQHGVCINPDFCECDRGWFGDHCSFQCIHGEWLGMDETCKCVDGWSGSKCESAVCDSPSCINGHCTAPNHCECLIGWTGADCAEDAFSLYAPQILRGLSFRQRRLPSLIANSGGDQIAHDQWRFIRKWTGSVDTEFKLAKSKYLSILPQNDSILHLGQNRFQSCAMVGTSAKMLDRDLGELIDFHDAVLRLDDAPTKGFEQHVGEKTSFRIIDEAFVQGLLRASSMEVVGIYKKKLTRSERYPVLLWRAESFFSYEALKKKLPDEIIELLSPEFLVQVSRMYEAITNRLSDELNMTTTVSERAFVTANEPGNRAQAELQSEAIRPQDPSSVIPEPFVAAVFLNQICKEVNVFGFDELKGEDKYEQKASEKYFGNSRSRGASKQHVTKYSGADTIGSRTSALHLDFILLKLLHVVGDVRFCKVETVEECLKNSLLLAKLDEMV